MSTTAAQPPKRMRLASGAVLIPQARYAEWHQHASAMPGVNDIERKVLDTIREWHRRLYVEEFAGSLSHVRMTRHLDVDPVHVRWAIDRLLRLGLIAVKPGAGGRANTYLPSLPRRLAASMAPAAAVDELVPPRAWPTAQAASSPQPAVPDDDDDLVAPF